MQSIMPWIGVLFLVFGLLDYLFILAPMDFMNPLWEFRFFGQLVDHVWGPLFGLALILTPLANTTSYIELKARALLSWIALGLALCYIFVLPFGIITANRIYEGLNRVRASELEQRSTAVEVAMDALYEMDSVEEIRARTQDLGLKTSLYAEPELLKLKENIEDIYRKLHAERTETLEVNYRSQVRSLFITLVKGVLGAVVSMIGFFFLFIKSRSYRQLLKQDALGKGGASGFKDVSAADEDGDEGMDVPREG